MCEEQRKPYAKWKLFELKYPVFIINLDRQVERLKAMTDQLEAVGITPIRLPAFNGRDPNARATAKVASYAPLTGGEIGCFESHRHFWQHIVDGDLDGAFVMEDDVAIASDFAELEFPQTLLEQADMIKIDQSRPRTSIYGTQRIALAHGRTVVRMLGSEMSTGCYFVTRKGAQRLLDAAQNYILPVDIFLFDQASQYFWDFNVWKLCDAAAAQLHMLSHNETLAPEFQDRIQGAARPEQERSLSALWHKTRLRLRRMQDKDTAAKRTARSEQAISVFSKSEKTWEGHVRFSTPQVGHLHALFPSDALVQAEDGLWIKKAKPK